MAMDFFAFNTRKSQSSIRSRDAHVWEDVRPIDNIIDHLRKETKENHFVGSGFLPDSEWGDGLPSRRKLPQIDKSYHRPLSTLENGVENLSDDDDAFFLKLLPICKKRFDRDKGKIMARSTPSSRHNILSGTLPTINYAQSSSTRNPLASVALEKSTGETVNEQLRNNRDETNRKLCGPLHKRFDLKESPTRESMQRITRNDCNGVVLAPVPSKLCEAVEDDGQSFVTTLPTSLRKRRRQHRHRPSNENQVKISDKWRVGAVDLVLPPTREEMIEAFQARDEKRGHIRRQKDIIEAEEKKIIQETIEKKGLARIQANELKALQARQKDALKFLALVNTTVGWISSVPPVIERYRIHCALSSAAAKIQVMWKNELFVRKAMEARAVNRKLKKIGWRLRLWGQCTRRKLNAQLLRSFFSDFSIQQLNYIMYTFRYRVMKAQRFFRSFIECKKARQHALEKYWIELEVEVLHGDIRKKRKNALGGQRISMPKKSSKWHKIQILPSLDGDRSGVNLVKTLCRYHMEDERKSHRLKCTEYMGDGPIVNQHQAKLLLSGEPVTVDLEGKKTWPQFHLFHPGRRRLQNKIELLVQDEDAVKKQTEERLQADEVAIMANRYAGSIDDEEGNEFVSHDQAKTSSRIDKENDELALKYGLSRTEVLELREIFQLVDLDGGGTIDAEEMGKLLDLLGMQKAEDEIEEIMNAIDKTGSGEVNFKDFVWALKANVPKPTYSEKMLLLAFRCFAKDMPKGQIKNEQLFGVLTSYAGKWDETSARTAMCDVGLDGTVIDYEQFVTIMFQLCKE